MQVPEFQVKSYNCTEEFLVFRLSSIWAWMPVCEGTMQGQASFLSFSLLHEGAAAAAEGTRENSQGSLISSLALFSGASLF